MKYELAKLRKTRGFSQAKLAEITGLTQQSIFRIENGERDIDISEALRIASALRCKIKDIVVCNTEEQSAFDDLDNLNRIAAPSVLLKSIRLKAGVSIENIAAALNISKAAYIHYEEENASDNDNRAYAKILDICTIILMLRSFSSITENLKDKMSGRKLSEDQEEILNIYDSLAKADKTRAQILMKSLSPEEIQ